jgi:MFS transporter, OHS family, lactose permease
VVFILGFCFNAGAPAVEAFIEKVSRRSNFEFGRARMFGCVGWALCASIVGIMFTINNQFVFWLGSGCALLLAVLLFFAKTDAPLFCHGCQCGRCQPFGI